MDLLALRCIETFAQLGRPLGPADAVPAETIDAAGAVLRCDIPEALRAFHRVAGAALDVVDCYDHLVPPDGWHLADDKLIFYVENQAVVLYAIATATPGPDPPVLMTSNLEPYVWHPVCDTCSTFLAVMTLWQCAFGGALPVRGIAHVEPGARASLASRLEFVGEVNEMSAFLGPGLAACLVPWDGGWRIFAGARDDAALAPLRDLGMSPSIATPLG